MTRFIIGRAAACGGALVLAIGAGCIVAPAAYADTGTGGVGLGSGSSSSSGSLGGALGQTVTGLTNGLGLTAPSSTSTSTSPSTGGSGSTSSVPTATATNGSGTSASTSSVTGGGTGVPIVDTTVPVVTGTVQDLLGGVTGATGTGALIGGTTAIGTGSGGISVTIGQDGSGGSLVDVDLGGQHSGSLGASGSAGADGTNGTNGTNAGGVTSAVSDLLGLHVRRSLATVYPVKDGYRDQVAFTLDGLTSNGQPQALTGVAVLKRGTTAVQRWDISRSDQVLTWNGQSGSKIVAGTYRLVVGAKDAAGHAFSAVTSVKVSAKRLVASTQRVKALAVSGTHKMVAAPRAGLSRGAVTLRVTTVATKVKGKSQKLIFEKDGKRLIVPVKKGTHTSRKITIPSNFTSYRLLHTWKKGQVKLKSIKYTYSYQSLR